MRNLKLPSLKYGQVKPGKLCYATEATVDSTGWHAVYHHASLIATVEADSVYISTAGYDSSTTVDRIDRVLLDNEVGYRVALRKGETHLFQVKRPFDSEQSVWIDLGYINSAGFIKDADGWHLAHR